jgi:tmRNA-binding protein
VSGVKFVVMSEKSESYKIVSDNRQARFRYEILETYEAGIELKGTEVKSIREGKANLRDGYALIRNGVSLATKRAYLTLRTQQ